MARTLYVGRCRRCRIGESGCCRSRRRSARGRQRPRVCGNCRAARYPNEPAAVDVALAASLAAGTTHFVYPCPVGQGYHTAPTYRRSNLR